MLYARAPQKLVGADTENLGKRVQLDIRDRTALSFQKGERGNAQVYAAKLQLRKKLYLLHAARQPKLRHARADQIPCTKFQLSCPHAPYLHSVQIIGGLVLAIFGNTKYNKFSNTKFERTCVYGICRAKPAVGGLPAMRRPGWLSCARGRGVVLRGMRASARAVFAAGTSEIEKKKAGNVLTNITCLVREMRLELTRLLPHAPQTCLSTYTSTLALHHQCSVIITARC